MKADSKKVRELISMVRAECKKYGIACKIKNVKYLKVDGLACSGFFDPDEKVLEVATGRPFKEWIYTFMHEYNHLVQWANKEKVWTDCMMGRKDSSEILDDWLNGKNHRYSTVKKAIDKIIMVEYDCEKKTVALAKKLKFPLDTAEYTQKALSYVYFYHQVLARRKWSKPMRGPYRIKSVWSKMPRSFKVDPLNKEEILKKYNFDKCF